MLNLGSINNNVTTILQRATPNVYDLDTRQIPLDDQNRMLVSEAIFYFPPDIQITEQSISLLKLDTSFRLEVFSRDRNTNDFYTFVDDILVSFRGDQTLGGLLEWARLGSFKLSYDYERFGDNIKHAEIIYNIRLHVADVLPIDDSSYSDSQGFNLNIQNSSGQTLINGATS